MTNSADDRVQITDETVYNVWERRRELLERLTEEEHRMIMEELKRLLKRSLGNRDLLSVNELGTQLDLLLR